MSRTPYKNLSHATSTEWDRLSTQSYLRGVEVEAMKLIPEYSVVSVKSDVTDGLAARPASILCEDEVERSLEIATCNKRKTIQLVSCII